MEYIYHLPSPLGGVTLTSDGAALTGLWFDGKRSFVCAPDDGSAEQRLPVFDEAACWLRHYFAGEDPGTPPPLRPRGPPFQMEVWGMLRAIPYGATTTYGRVAAQLQAQNGRKTSARAVGGAVGRNPIWLMIPCHRVVGAGGRLIGYAGGLERKQELLHLEHAAISRGESGSALFGR